MVTMSSLEVPIVGYNYVKNLTNEILIYETK